MVDLKGISGEASGCLGSVDKTKQKNNPKEAKYNQKKVVLKLSKPE